DARVNLPWSTRPIVANACKPASTLIAPVGVQMIAVSRAQRTRSGSAATTIALVVLVGLGALLAARPFIAQATTVPPGQLPSWNPAVGCTAILTSIEGVIGSQRNANGGAAYGGGGFIPGIPDKRSTSP